MVKKTKTNQTTDWYELWMQQSKTFFDSAHEQLKKFQEKDLFSDPKKHSAEIEEWVKQLQELWETKIPPHDDNNPYEKYWHLMQTMCNEATELMVKEWMQRSSHQNKITSIRELYELWLDCCQEVYNKTTRDKIYQDAYGEFLNAAFDYWQTILPKRDK